MLQQDYPALSKDRADRTIIEPLSITNATVDLACTTSWKCVIDQKTVSISCFRSAWY